MSVMGRACSTHVITSRGTYLSRAARCVVRKYLSANACHLTCDVVCLTKHHATETLRR